MKILCISDLHGKFPNRLYSFAKEKKPDLILAAGDITESDTLRKLQFENWDILHKQKKTIEDLIGKKRYKMILKSSAESARDMLAKLNRLDAPVILIEGNAEHCAESLAPYNLQKLGIENIALQFENILLLDKSFIEVDDIAIITHGGYRGIKSKAKKDSKTSLKYAAHKKQYIKELECLFKNMKDRKRSIFLTHDIPFNMKMDLVDMKSSPMHGRHVGDDIYRLFIEKYQPAINICGHMHENQGQEMLKNTIVANCGYAHDGECCVLKMKDKKTTVKFYKL